MPKATKTQTVYQALAGVEDDIRKMILAGIYDMKHAANELSDIGANDMLRRINHTGTYRGYMFKGRLRYSSRPGEAPAAYWGETLEPSIYAKHGTKTNQNPATAEFGSTAPFADELEYGSAKIAPRPFLRPAREFVASRAAYVVDRYLRRAYMRKAAQAERNVIIEVNI